MLTVYLTDARRGTEQELSALLEALPLQRRQRIAALKQPLVQRETLIATFLTYVAANRDCTAQAVTEVSMAELLTYAPAVSALAGSLDWVTSPTGKPFADGMDTPHGRRFVSLSHSGGIAAVALADEPVGVDIENPRSMSIASMQRILARCHVLEQQRFAATDTASQEDAFYRLWTAKESVMKLCGKGLALPLSSFWVSEDEAEAEGTRIALLSGKRTITDTPVYFTTAQWKKY